MWVSTGFNASFAPSIEQSAMISERGRGRNRDLEGRGRGSIRGRILWRQTKFVFLNLSNVHLSIKIVDGTQSPVLGNGIVQATLSLILLISYMFYDFSLVSCLSVSLLNIIIAK